MSVRKSFLMAEGVRIFLITSEGKKGKDITVTGREGPYGCETSKPPHFLDNRLTDGCEVVSLTRRPPFTARTSPAIHFC
jgi:hypothetical protein